MELENKSKSKRSNVALILLGVLLVFALITIVGLAVAYGVNRNKSEKQTFNADTADSIILAGEILARMDLTANPCDDFYQFACGTYSKPENRPPDVEIMMTFGIAGQTTQLTLANLLASPGNKFRGMESSAVAKVKKLYAVCMNDTGDNEEGKNVLLDVIKNLMYWPLSTNAASKDWDSGNWNIEDVLTKVRVYQEELGSNAPFFSISLSAHPHNSSKYILYVEASGLTLEESQYSNNKTVELAYKEFVENILSLLYGNSNQAQHKVWSDKLWLFEKSLANSFPSDDDSDNSSLVTSVSDMQEKVKFLDVKRLLDKCFDGTDVKVTGETELILNTPEYFKRLSKLIKAPDSQDKEMLSAYIVWATIHKHTNYAGNSFKKAHEEFNRKLHGTDPVGVPKWKTCSQEAVSWLGFAAGAVYADKHFKTEDKSILLELANLTVDEFVIGLPHIDWLQSETRIKVEEKARAVKWHIGYPEVLNDSNKLDEYYRDFSVSDNRCQNKLESLHFQFKSIAKKYNQTMYKNDWPFMPTLGNAFYDVSTNQVIVFGGLLQKPIYSRDFPMSMLFGGIGYVMAHELVHGIDSNGRNYDLRGILNNWWDNKSDIEYNQRANCFRDQYSALNFQRHQVNGELTLGENVADCGGVKIAYKSYKRAASENTTKLLDTVLPGLNLTGPQQFFLATAQTWCINVNDNIAAEQLLQDSHSPGPVRVNTPLKNTPEFAEVFGCPKESPMNPKHRCSLW